MNPAELFAANLPLVDRVIAGVCRRAGVRAADAEDFASTARIALMENDYAILRTYEGRSSLGTFLTIVVQRLLSRERSRIWGRWHSSAEAERLGAAGVLLEQLLVRDGRSLEEAIPFVRAIDPSLDRRSVQDLAARLPERAARPRLVPLPDEVDVASPEGADARASDAESRRISARAAAVVRETLESLALEDRMLIRFRFGAELSIADASRLLGVPQRPLYRRIEALLTMLREALERAGVGAMEVSDLISATAADGIDFGLHGKSDDARHSNEVREGRT
ncbi:MAG: polymerase sigma factor, sigma-70 family [Acidobacteria bacterium]|nr:polymerase sigma factor, sigma-70 family [Acidobacteriota bacterium]